VAGDAASRRRASRHGAGPTGRRGRDRQARSPDEDGGRTNGALHGYQARTGERAYQAAVGQIVDELQAQGTADTTLIVVIGDNGCFHGGAPHASDEPGPAPPV
jgi:hypothetical protein